MSRCQNIGCGIPAVKTIKVGNNSVRHLCQGCLDKKTPSQLSNYKIKNKVTKNEP